MHPVMMAEPMRNEMIAASLKGQLDLPRGGLGSSDIVWASSSWLLKSSSGISGFGMATYGGGRVLFDRGMMSVRYVLCSG